MSNPNNPASDPSRFGTTRWTLVREAGGGSPEACEALRELCAAYYAPVVAFLRRDGRTEDAARELGHGFFATLLSGGLGEGAAPGRGRFRSYLLGAVKHFLANQRRDAARAKRGGGVEFVPIDGGTETSPGLEPADPSPRPLDAAFDRAWALAILDRCLARVELEEQARGRSHAFSILRPWLVPSPPGTTQAEAAHRLGCSEDAFKTAVHRLRRHFRELVRAEVAATLADPSDLADEMRHLVRALSAE